MKHELNHSDKPSFPLSPLSGIFNMAADKLGHLVGSPRNPLPKDEKRGSLVKADAEEEFDLI
jgi:hypothetical protein